MDWLYDLERSIIVLCHWLFTSTISSVVPSRIMIECVVSARCGLVCWLDLNTRNLLLLRHAPDSMVTKSIRICIIYWLGLHMHLIEPLVRFLAQKSLICWSFTHHTFVRKDASEMWVSRSIWLNSLMVVAAAICSTGCSLIEEFCCCVVRLLAHKWYIWRHSEVLQWRCGPSQWIPLLVYCQFMLVYFSCYWHVCSDLAQNFILTCVRINLECLWKLSWNVVIKWCLLRKDVTLLRVTVLWR